MFNVGDAVVYANTGVCVIDDIRTEAFLGKKELYYILQPVSSKGSMIFCPVENTRVVIRRVCTKDELDAALSSSECPEISWIENDNERKAYFQGVLKNCVFGETVQIIRCLHLKKKEKADAGKKLHAIDEKFLADAEKMLFGEIAYVYGISAEEAAQLFNR